MNDFSSKKTDAAGTERRFGRVRELAQRFIDKTITESEADELLDIWARNPSLFEEIRNDLEMDYVLRYMAERRDVPLSFIFEPKPVRLVSGGETGPWTTETLDLAGQDISVLLEKLAMPGVSFPRYPRRFLLGSRPAMAGFRKKFLPWLTVCTVLLCVVLGILLWNRPYPSTEIASKDRVIRPIAVMTDGADEQWTTSVPPFGPGEPIFSGTLALESGLLELLFFNGTRVVLEGPSELTFLEPEKIFLRRGNLSATVPPSGHGFETHTPHAVLTDLGTEFSVRVESEQTATHVLKGLVAVTPNGKPRVLLKESASITARMDGILQSIPFDRISFVSEALMRRASFDSPGNRERRKAVRAAMSVTPLLKLELDGSETEMQRVRQFGGKFDPGRSENEIAFRFRERKDYLTVSIPQTLESVTLAAWVCLDSLPEHGNPILTSRDERRGGITWQVNSSGSVSIGIRSKNRQLARNYESPILIGPERLGKWIHLAASVDMRRQTASLYLDGRIVYQVPVAETAPILIGEAVIGNRINRNVPIGHFHGRIDSLEIHDRALSPDELFVLYQRQWEENNDE